MINPINHPINKQSGVALFMGLIIVAILTLLVMTSSRTVIVQGKMTANLRDKELGFQSAETALKGGENYVRQSTEEHLAGAFNGTNGLYTYNKNRALAEESDWSNLNVVNSEALHQVGQIPTYIIEELPLITTQGNSLAKPQAVVGGYYRITSKSQGGTENAVSILQSVYIK